MLANPTGVCCGEADAAVGAVFAQPVVGGREQSVRVLRLVNNVYHPKSDFILKNNRVFRDFLNSQNVDLTYYESEGIHDWKFWNQYLEPAICWGLEEKVEEKEDENY